MKKRNLRRENLSRIEKIKYNKRGQVDLSFGMIFSIFLIIIFIAFAFYAIGKFLDIQKSAKTGQFTENLQTNVDSMWKSSSGSQQIEYSLPDSIELVCFQNFDAGKTGQRQDIYNDLRLAHSQNENLIFYPVGSSGAIDSIELKNINLEIMTANENPYCIKNIDGKVNLTIKKDLGEALVIITR